MKLRIILPIATLSTAIVFITCNVKKLARNTGNTLLTHATPLSGGTICDSCLYANIGEWVPNITYKQALLLAQNYRSDIGKQYVYKNGRMTSEKDALSIRFDLKEMKNFIEAIERNACSSNCNDRLGIRIYYGRYPIKDSMLKWELNPDFAERHTIFMVPTYFDLASGKHFDFMGSGNCSATVAAHKTLYVYGPDAKNHGGIMPPPEGAGIFPTTIEP